MATLNASQSIAPSFTPVTSPQIADSEPQGTLHTGPTGVVRRGAGRASNEARAWLAVANVTPTGYRVGVFMANHSRYARAADRRRNVAPAEIFCFWPQAKIAAELGCSERQVSRGVRSLREAGALTVRQRVRPCEASYVWSRSVGSDVGSHVGSGVVSGVGSHTEPRTEPRREARTEAAAASPSDRTEVQHDEHKPQPATAGRHTCPTCGHNWPARYGTTCYQCPQPTGSQLRRREQRKRDRLSEQDPPPDEAPARPDPAPMTPETRAQLETEAIENGYHKRDDGSWTKAPQPTTDGSPSPSPSPPTVPATPEQAQPHIEAMLQTARRARAPQPRRRGGGWTKLTSPPANEGDEPQAWDTLLARLLPLPSRRHTEGHTEGGWSLVWPVFTGVESGLRRG